MVRYIKAEDLIFGIDNTPTPTGFLSVDYIKGMIDALPAEDVSPVVHAYWIKHDYAEEVDDRIIPNYECSHCHQWFRDDRDYCGECGAKMDEEE